MNLSFSLVRLQEVASAVPDMCIYECLTTPFLLFKQKNTGTFFIYRIHYPLLCVPKWQELKNKPHLGCFLFTWAPRLCQTRQGSFPGRW